MTNIPYSSDMIVQLDGINDLSDYGPVPELSYPNVMAINARSIMPKINSLFTLVEELNCDIVLLTETWEVNDKPEHRATVNQIVNGKNYSWISNPRLGRGGGGSGILINYMNFANCRISCISDLHPPATVESTWAMITPRSRANIKIALCAIYMPPRLCVADVKACQEYVVAAADRIVRKFKQVKFVIGGDLNTFNLDVLFCIDNDMKQIVNFPTCGVSFLDKIYMNLGVSSVEKIAPLPIDDPSRGRASNHDIVLANFLQPEPSSKWTKIKKRTFSEENFCKFENFLHNKNWRRLLLNAGTDCNSKAEALDCELSHGLNLCFPLKTVKVKVDDDLWLNDSVKCLIKLRNSVFKREGKSQRWLYLKYACRSKIHFTKRQFYKHSIDSLKNLNPRRWHEHMKRLGCREKRPSREEPYVPQYFGMTDLERADASARFLSDYTSHYEPFNVESFSADFDDLPVDDNFHVTVDIVAEILKNMKIPNGCSLHDLPKQIISRFSNILAVPLCDLFNCILSSKKWPDKWKVESTFFINKKKETESIADLRPIALTPFWSKALENFVKNKLQDTLLLIDPSQFAAPRSSPNDYFAVFFMK